MKVNPYQAFAPVSLKDTFNLALDRSIEMNTSRLSPIIGRS